jgi:hypothetical protein
MIAWNATSFRGPVDGRVMPEKTRNDVCWLFVYLMRASNLTGFGAITMKQTIATLAAIVLFSACPLYADYTVEDRGSWPDDWPKELEPLRAQSRTLEGPTRPSLHYAIPFTKREAFEAAWPHLLAVKSQGAPIVLRRGPSFWLGNESNAGVCIHTPPAGKTPITDAKEVDGNWERTIYIELIVDGEIVDLNRILLPADTPIIDERFKDDMIER